MFKGVRKKLKSLKDKEKKYKPPLVFDEAGRMVIDVHLSDFSDAYTPFSPPDNRRIDEGLMDYLKAENPLRPYPLVIRVSGLSEKNDDDRRKEFENTLHTACDKERHHRYLAHRTCLFRSLVCLLGGLLILALSIVLQLTLKSAEVILVSVEILSWVFIWEAADLFFFERPDLKRRYYYFAKLSTADLIYAA